MRSCSARRPRVLAVRPSMIILSRSCRTSLPSYVGCSIRSTAMAAPPYQQLGLVSASLGTDTGPGLSPWASGFCMADDNCKQRT